jgi:uncharacterized membrane protein
MDGFLKVGRLFFAVAMVLFGVQYFIYASSMKGPIPGPPWTPGLHSLAWLTGVALVVIGASIATGKMARLSALLLGVGLSLKVLFLHAPVLIAQLHNPGPWTSTFELLAILGGAFVLARIAAANESSPQPSSSIVSALAEVGRFLFAIALVVFAVQHFLYARFVATLVPAWIPGHLFWAYFTGAAFVAAALAIATKQRARLASAWLGIMFLLWVIVLHAPRVAATSRNGDEWTSMLVALAMSGAAFILAESFAIDRA